MPIDAGDVVLTALLDLSKVDEGLTTLKARIPLTFQGAADGAKEFNQELDATGQNAEFAGERIVESMGASRHEMREAKGELGLLGELFGIHLPRHVRTFIAEIGGVGAVLSSAFAATAVIFIVEALAKGVEKLIEWSQEAHKLELAQEDFHTGVLKSFNTLDEKLLESGIKLDELRGDHVAALHKELELINRQKFDQLEGEFGNLAKLADAMFNELKSQWFGLVAGSTGAASALKDFKSHYDLLLAEGKDKEANDLLQGTLQSAKTALATMQQAKKVGDDMAAEAAKLGGGGGEIPAASRNELKAQETLVEILEAQVKARQKINQLAQENKDVKIAQERKQEAQDEEKAERERLKLEHELEQATEKRDRAQKGLNEENAKFDKLSHDTITQMEKFGVVEVNIKNNNPFPQAIQDLIRMDNALKTVGVQGLLTLQNNLTKAERAEKLLNDQGIHGGKLWLEVQAAKLKAIIAIEQAEGRNATAEVKRLHQIEGELKRFDKEFKTTQKTVHDVMEQMKKDTEQFATDLGVAMGAALAAHESAGAALLAETAHLIGTMAKHWSEYFAALAIAEFWTNPAKAAAEVAAAIALGALAGALGSVGGGASGSGGGGGGGGSTAAAPGPASQPEQQPVAVHNVQHFQSGGLLSSPTMAIVGDSREVILPLDRDRRAINEVASAIMERMHAADGGGATTINQYFKGDLIDHTMLMRQMNRKVSQGKGRLLASNANRLTRKS